MSSFSFFDDRVFFFSFSLTHACTRLIYCSDTFSAYETDYKQMARFVISLPRKKAEFEAVGQAVTLALRLVDRFAGMTLSSHSLSKAKALRKKAQAEKAKETRAEMEARAEERKLAKLAAEREKVNNLSGKERAKAEEKIRKRQAKEQEKKLKGRSKVIK